MRLDFGKHDALITLSCDRRRGTWGVQTLVRGSKTIRTAGQLPTTSTAHTLFAVALVAALGAITRSHAQRLVQTAAQPVAKPRVLVVTDDDAFREALTARDVPTRRPLRAGRNFVDVLSWQLSRFDVTFSTPDDNSVLALGNWMGQNLPSPKLIATAPPAFLPRAISRVV